MIINSNNSLHVHVYSPLSFIIHFHMHHLFEASHQFYAAGKAKGSIPIL